VSGSLILAGVLLKPDGYGFLLLLLFSVLFRSGLGFGIIWVFLSVVGGLVVSLFCIWPTYFKSFISYSSVAHQAWLLVV
jgi:NADH:ubiquinone oxidoreductase subunit 4 (subunit M)